MTSFPPIPDPDRRPPRRGASVMELVVAVTVLTTVTAMLLPAARRVDVVRFEADRRRRAAAELSNVLTDLSRLPLDQLTAEDPSPDGEGRPLSPDLAALREPFAASLPDATVTVTAVPMAVPNVSRAVRLDGALSWTTDAGAPARPVQLSAWAFESGSTNPDAGEENE